MGFLGNLLGAYLGALMVFTLMNFSPFKEIIAYFFGITISVSSLTVIIFGFNTFGLWNIWGQAKGTAEGWWAKIVGGNKYRGWGLLLIIIGVLRLRETVLSFQLPSFIGFFTNLLGLSKDNSLYLIGFTENIEWGAVQFVVGIPILLYSFWYGMKISALQKGRIAEFPLLGWLRKKRSGIGIMERDIDKALYSRIGTLAPLVELEYKAVILKINKLEKQEQKGKPISHSLLNKLIKSEEDIKRRIIMKVVEEGGIEHRLLDAIMRERVAGGMPAEKIPERKAELAFRYIKQMTLPGSKKYLSQDWKVREGSNQSAQPAQQGR